MKKFLLPTIGLLASLLSAQGQYFTTGDLAVVRIGGPGQSVTTSGGGNTVYIDEYTVSGTLVQSYAIPSSGSDALILSGSAYEGYITLTPDGTRLVIGGFNTGAPYTSNGVVQNVGFSPSSIVPRAIATIDGYGNYALPIVNFNMFNTYTISGAASDGSNFWALGTGATAPGASGVVYAGTALLGATNQLAPGLFGGGRNLTLYNNALYALGYTSNGLFKTNIYGAGAYMLSNISGALPTTATAYTNRFPSGTSANSTAADLVINPAGTLAYLADYSLGIVKYTNSGLPGDLWVSNYTIVLTNAGYSSASGSAHAISVAADFAQNPVVLFATTGETITNRLVTLLDTGANATVVNLASNLLVAGAGGSTNTFRGVRFVPGSPPIITNEPSPVIVDAGQTATFSVAASGSPAPTYQWYSNSVADPTFVAILSATNSTLNLLNTTDAQSNSMFYVIVSNPYGTDTSSNVTLTVNPPGPPTSVQVIPGSQRVNAGSVAVFNATFIGANTSLSFGWTHDGAPLVDGLLGASSISGSTTATLTISNALAVADGNYEVFVTNSLGSGSGGPGVLQVNDPAIITNVMGATNLPGSGPVTLSVSADGTGLTYQWLSNGIALSGANSSTYTVPNSAAPLVASYSVVVSNSLGAAVTNGPTVVSFSPYLLNDTFSYPDGNLFGDAGSPWTDINGSRPELVISDRVQIAETNATTDAQDLFAQPEGGTVVWASFIVNLSSLPSKPGGIYFANFEDTNFGFYGRIFSLTSNSPSLTPDISPVAYPGTYRLGIANNRNDSTGTATTGPSAVVELDMAPGIDYQVVAFYDLASGYCQMAVNPSQTESNQVSDAGGATVPSTITSGPALDTFKASGLPMAAYGLRQRPGEGIMQLDNLEVSFDWNGPFSGFAAVTANVTPALPQIGLLTPGVTNYSGNSSVLEVAASGIDLTYAWYQDGVALSDGASLTGSAKAALTINPLVGTNSGNYTVVISNAAGSVTSSIVPVSVNTTVTAPVFTVQPAASTTLAEGGNVTFTAMAVGTGPITYQWYWNSLSNPQSGGTAASFSLSGLSTAQAGNYFVVATGGTGLTGQSSNAVLVVTAPVATNIHYLRSLQNPNVEPITVSDTTTLYTIQGVITTATNLTSGDTASYYVQDSTGGMDLFVTGDSTFRPALGDVVTATGVLDVYYDTLELYVVAGAPFNNYGILTNNDGSPVTNALPAPFLLPWGYTTAYPAPTATNIAGSIVTMTNVYFTTPGTFSSGTDTYPVTNASGQQLTVFVSAQDTNFDGQPIPGFAYSVTGVLYDYDPGYQVIVTRYSDMVTAPPPAVSVAGALSGPGNGNVTLTWTAVPYTYTYSVWSSTNLTQPFTKLTAGLWFATANGTYTDVGPASAAKFYRIVSP